MKLFFLPLKSLIISLVFARLGFAAPHPFDISEDLDRTIKAGLNELYNLHFDEALATFKTVESQAQDHPMVAFGIASVHWWRLSVYVLETDPVESEAFLKAADECIRLSEKKIEKGDLTGEGYLTLGGTYGILGRWKATNRQWMSAYFSGRKAVKYLRRSLKINPQLKDANMGLGIFDYFVATLPSVVRALAFLGANNDPKVGIRELEEAAREGTYARTPARLFLMDIYSNWERNAERSFEIIRDLRNEFPVSPFIHMLHVIALYNHNKLAELHKEAMDYVERVKKGIYQEAFYPEAFFSAGLSHFKARDWQKAVEQFDQAVQHGNNRNPFFIWAHLYKGYALDALKKRDQAEAEYKFVLDEKRRWGSHDHAKARLKKPFSENEPELEKVKL